MPAGEYCYAGLRPDPRFIALLFRGSSTGITFVRQRRCRNKRAIPYSIAPSETSWRSGRTAALPYPPLLAR